MPFFVYDPESPWEAGNCRDEDELEQYLNLIPEGEPCPTIIEYEVDGYARDITERVANKREAIREAEALFMDGPSYDDDPPHYREY
jgi:hypothetical protein